MTNNLKAERTLTAEEELGALEAIIHELAGEVAPNGPEDRAWALINDLRKSLSTQQPMGEPVAWLCEDLIMPNVSVIDDWEHAQARMRQPKAWRVTPLYALHPNQESGE